MCGDYLADGGTMTGDHRCAIRLDLLTERLPGGEGGVTKQPPLQPHTTRSDE